MSEQINHFLLPIVNGEKSKCFGSIHLRKSWEISVCLFIELQGEKKTMFYVLKH